MRIWHVYECPQRPDPLELEIHVIKLLTWVLIGEPNSGPLEECYMFLFTVPSLQPLVSIPQAVC